MEGGGGGGAAERVTIYSTLYSTLQSQDPRAVRADAEVVARLVVKDWLRTA